MRMNQKRFFIVVLLVLIVARRSDASLLGKVRKLVGVGLQKKKVQISPAPGPVLSANPGPSRESSGNAPANSPKADPTDGFTNERCEMSLNKCRDQKSMTACIQFPGRAHEELSLIVQNDGESTLNVKISPVNIPSKDMQIPKHKAKKINFLTTTGKIPSIVLNSGNGDCVILMRAPSQDDFFKQVTPIHGVFLLSFTALIIGWTWACCKWGKRGRQVDGVPYQELEMGQTDSPSAINVETANGWDQGWDEDWDEEKGVKSPGGNHVRNVSANGLNSRSSNRDGWENNWDD